MSVRPHRPSVAVLSASLVVALSACAAAATPHATSALGSVASASASASPPTSATPTPTSESPSPRPPSFPKTAQGYAQAALDAYVKGNQSRLTELSTLAGKINFDNIHPSNAHWHYNQCDANAPTSCTFDNDNGDRVQVQVDVASLGKPHAIVNVVLDKTEYGTSADAMVGTFMQAWFDGNVYRMKILSTPTVTSYFVHYTPQQSWTLSDDSGAGHTHVHITNLDGFDQTVDVDIAKIGQAHAIAAVCNPSCA